MDKLLQKLKFKCDLDKFNKKELKEFLSEEDNYEDFINDLYLVLDEDIGYEFVELDKLKTIRKAIKAKGETRKLTADEKKLLKFLKLDGLDLVQKLDFKTQYIYTSLYNLGVPTALRDEKFYKEVLHQSYENIYRFYELLNNPNEFYVENNISTLACDITSLATVNMIINEAENIDEGLYEFLVDLSVASPEKKFFDSSRDYYRYKRYQRKTLKNIKAKAYKIDAYDNEKTLVK